MGGQAIRGGFGVFLPRIDGCRTTHLVVFGGQGFANRAQIACKKVCSNHNESMLLSH
jgi:hypothetical protein